MIWSKVTEEHQSVKWHDLMLNHLLLVFPLYMLGDLQSNRSFAVELCQFYSA